jgi:hypothetical protein
MQFIKPLQIISIGLTTNGVWLPSGEIWIWLVVTIFIKSPATMGVLVWAKEKDAVPTKKLF